MRRIRTTTKLTWAAGTTAHRPGAPATTTLAAAEGEEAARAEMIRWAERCGSEVNVGPVQRGVSALAGVALVAAGLRRPTLGGVALAGAGTSLLYRATTGYCHLFGALGIDTARDDDGGAPSDAVEIRRSITIQRPRDEVYRRWRDPQSQPRVWSHFAELTNATEQGAHWRFEAPLGRTLGWDARVVDERPGELVAWEAAEGADLRNEGTVEFRDAPGDWGTEITLRVRFDPPAGLLGDAAARVLDDPPKLVLEKALRRFKSLVETGEIPSTDQNPSARN